MKVRTVEWKAGRVVMLDQRLLPNREVYRIYDDPAEVMAGIREMVVRGAPAMLTENIQPSMLFANGACSYVHSLSPLDDEPPE